MSDLHDRITKVDDLIDFILYGDIHEMPPNILGTSAYDPQYVTDLEAEARQQVAACVKAWSLGRLTKGGWFAYDDNQHGV